MSRRKPLQPLKIMPQKVSTAMAAVTSLILITGLIRHLRDGVGSKAFQERAGIGEIKFGVHRFDTQKEAVSRNRCELWHVEHRVVGLWQSVHREHSNRGCQSAKQNRQLKTDNDERGPRMQRATTDVQRIGTKIDPRLQYVSGSQAKQATHQAH